MDFEFTEEQKMIRAMVRDFAEKEIAPVASEANRREECPMGVVKRMCEMGFFGLILPVEYGGGGADYISYCIMLEELGRVDVGMAAMVSPHISLVCKNILKFGDEAQKQRYLPKLATGEMLACLGSTEPNVGSDVAAMETMAVKDGDNWVINGNKMWITNGGIADVALVIAQTDKSQGGKGITAFIVEKGTPGFSSQDIHHKLGMRSSNTAELIFEDCRIPEKNMLGPVGKGMTIALTGFDSARIGVIARSIGAAQACIEASVAYAQTRKQFGKPIGSYQLIQASLADMNVQTEAARLLMYRAAYLKDRGDAATVETSMAKYYASEIALKVANAAIQIHGSYGYSDEFPVERFMRDVRASLIVEGTSDIHKLIIGRSMTGINAF